jgi:hypothetical protein
MVDFQSENINLGIHILESLGMENVVIFYFGIFWGRLVYFMDIRYV